MSEAAVPRSRQTLRRCLRSDIELMNLESDPRWPVFIEKVTAAVQAGASATI